MPGLTPVSPVLHPVKEVFDGPAMGVSLEQLVRAQSTFGGDEQARLAECYIFVCELHPHGTYLMGTKEFGRADSGPVTYSLPFAIKNYPMADFSVQEPPHPGVFLEVR